MSEQTYDEKIQVALRNVENKESVPRQEDTVTLSSGVVLKFKKIPLLRLNAILDAFPYPPVPTYRDEEKKRTIENPLNENYLEQRRRIDEQRSMALIDAIVATGTEVLICPEHVTPLDSEDWIEELIVSHIPVTFTSKFGRYLAWIKFVAIREVSDLELIAEEYGLTLGISESRIAAAIQENFPDNEARNSDSPSASN